MNAPVQNRLQFDTATAIPPPDEPLMLDLEVWEGPLHVLLELAKAQKVDLRAISVTRLADQFLAFVRAAKGRRFAVAADYLVMAAWLTYLKSRLLLPKPESASPCACSNSTRCAARRRRWRRGRCWGGTCFRAAIQRPPSSSPTISWRAISTA
jgi:hypothetical protein